MVRSIRTFGDRNKTYITRAVTKHYIERTEHIAQNTAIELIWVVLNLPLHHMSTFCPSKRHVEARIWDAWRGDNEEKLLVYVEIWSIRFNLAYIRKTDRLPNAMFYVFIGCWTFLHTHVSLTIWPLQLDMGGRVEKGKLQAICNMMSFLLFHCDSCWLNSTY